MTDSKHKEPTANMKAVLLDLLDVVRTYDAGKAGLPHDVTGIHHMTLKAMAKADYGKLILLDASYSTSPIAVIWTVAITRYGLQVAKKLEKNNRVINALPINAPDKKPRALRTINWQVNINQDTGKQIYEDAKAMKADKKQSFTQTMNNLIAMHKELKAGQVALLQTLYPEAYATLLLIARNEIEMEREGELRGLIAEFKRHIQNAPQSSSMRPVNGLQPVNGSTQGNAPKVLNAPQFEVPNYDDEDDKENLLEVKKDEGAGLRAAMNFVASMKALTESDAKADPTKLSARQKGNK